MRGLRPLTSDQGPRKSETMTAGIAVKILIYMLREATSFCTAFSWFLKCVKSEQIVSLKLRLTKHTLSIRRFWKKLIKLCFYVHYKILCCYHFNFSLCIIFRIFLKYLFKPKLHTMRIEKPKYTHNEGCKIIRFQNIQGVNKKIFTSCRYQWSDSLAIIWTIFVIGI